MRKLHKNMILDIIRTLVSAASEVKMLFVKNDKQAAINLLADCQDCANQICELIEQFEGKEHITISYIRMYCELLYNISLDMENSNAVFDYKKALRKQLSVIKKSVENDIETRIEVVFFPYKACMFDSFETIWLAAKNDPQCDVYVVPVPYYDRKPNLSFGEMHYDGDEYPDYVPIVDWRNYNVEERHPDVVFIHNPYDENNYVTSVHPRYYSHELKKYADMLVYVPYFVLNEPSNVNFFNTSAHALKHADIIFVQSENVKKGYEKYIKNGEFVICGSPKIDKVINTKREDCILPDDWSNLIRGRKTVLYNTSLTSILHEGEQYLIKLRSVLEFFRERDDFVLWWRPHPLSKTTYNSMNPRLLNDYNRIIADYKCMNYGVYDDTADLHRAIAYTDAYYGDSSSLVLMYSVTGKPIMLQNAKITPHNGAFVDIFFENLYDDGEAFWFTALFFNGLFKMDKRTLETEYMGSFPNEKLRGFRFFNYAVHCDGKLYFAPFFASAAAEYDIKKNQFRTIPIDTTEEQEERYIRNKSCFFDTVNYRNFIFFVPSYYSAIVRYDVKSGNVDYFTDWVSKLEHLKLDMNMPSFRKHLAIGSSLFLPCVNTNAVVVFDMESCVSKVYEINNKEFRAAGMCFDGKNFWLAPNISGPIIKWNPYTGLYKEYYNYPDGFKPCECNQPSFRDIVFAGGFVWMPAFRANMSLKINVDNDSIEIAEEFMPECRIPTPEEAANYHFAVLADEKILTYSVKSCSFIEYDYKTGKRREKRIRFSEKDIKKVNENYPDMIAKDISNCLTLSDCVFTEDGLATLESFLNYMTNDLAQKDILSKKQIELAKGILYNCDGTSGNDIYSIIKKRIITT